MTEANKTVVRRLVDEVFNGGHLEVVDELYAPELAGAAKRWIAPFRASFPDVHMELVELIAEGDTVVGWRSSRRQLAVRWWASAASQVTPNRGSSAVGTHTASAAARPAALRDRSGPWAWSNRIRPRSFHCIAPCPSA